MKRVEPLQQFEPFPLPQPLNERFAAINENFAELAAASGIGEPGETVTSVAGRKGDVVLTLADVPGAAPLNSPSFTGTVQVNGKEVAVKDDIQAGGQVYTEATPSTSGLMSAADKTKLDGLQAGNVSQNLQGYVRTNGQSQMEGNLNMNGFRVIGMQTRFSQDAVSKGYLDTENEKVKREIRALVEGITIEINKVGADQEPSVEKSSEGGNIKFTINFPSA